MILPPPSEATIARPYCELVGITGAVPREVEALKNTSSFENVSSE